MVVCMHVHNTAIYHACDHRHAKLYSYACAVDDVLLQVDNLYLDLRQQLFAASQKQ